MPVTLGNNAVSRLASSMTAVATTISVTAGEGSKFPSLSAGNWFPLTLVKTSGALEIVRCTARSGDVFTVTRAQEGTAAQAFAAGDRVELRLTSGALDDIVQMINTLRNDALLDASNLSDLTDKAAARSNLELGTAAQKNVVTSSSDATAGRALVVGSGGILGPSMNGGSNANLSRDSGLYSFSSAANTPFANLNVLSSDWGADPTWQVQFGQAVNEARAFLRSIKKDQSAALAWVEIYTTGKLIAALNTFMNAATLAAARTAIGVPAGVDKQMCTAWVNFNGTGTPVIRDSFNVSSVTRLSTGVYQINFATPFANTSYTPIVGTDASSLRFGSYADAPTLNNLRISVKDTSNAASYDNATVSVAIFGGN